MRFDREMSRENGKKMSLKKSRKKRKNEKKEWKKREKTRNKQINREVNRKQGKTREKEEKKRRITIVLFLGNCDSIIFDSLNLSSLFVCRVVVAVVHSMKLNRFACIFPFIYGIHSLM